MDKSNSKSKTAAKIFFDLLADYHNSKKAFYDAQIPFFQIYRYLSFYPASVLIKLEVLPTIITFLAFVCLISSVLAFLFGAEYLALILFFSYFILDFCDGTVARFCEKTSDLGKFLDGGIDCLVFAIFPALVFTKSIEDGSFTLLFIGFINGYIFLLRCYFSIRKEWIFVGQDHSETATVKHLTQLRFVHRVGTVIKRIIEGFYSALPLAIVLVVIFDFHMEFQIAYLVVGVLGVSIILAHSIYRLVRIDISRG